MWLALLALLTTLPAMTRGLSIYKREIEPMDQQTNVTPSLKLERDVNILPYTTNFKNMMAEYVRQQHDNLTEENMATVKVTLDEFLQSFANDLQDILINKKIEDTEAVEDGIPDVTFDDIKRGIRAELSDATDEIADQIVYKLRKNLFNTRKKLDKIICNC